MDKNLKEQFIKATLAYNDFAYSFKAEMIEALKKYGLDGKLLPNIEMSECVKHRYVGTIKIWGTTNYLHRFCPYSFVYVSDMKDDDGKPIYKHWFDYHSNNWTDSDKTLDDFVKEEVVPFCIIQDK